MANPTETAYRAWPMFFGWLTVSFLWMVGIASILSIGVLILVLAGLGTWYMLRQPRYQLGLAGLISLGSAPFFLKARMNGPAQGTVLRSNGGGGVIGGHYSNPWPWVAVGVAVIIGSVVVFVVTTRRRD